MALPEIYEKLRDNVKNALRNNAITGEEEITPEIPEEPKALSDYIKQLFEDSKRWRDSSFVKRLVYEDPVKYWEDMFRLSCDDHWKVWGTRIANENDKWKAEIVEPEISSQIRVKKAYLTANWHQFDVMPNISRVNEVLHQEQEKTNWQKFFVETVDRQCTYGSVITKSIMDFDIDPRGVATEIICENTSVFPAPFSTGLTKEDGCWYFIYATLQPVWKVYETYRDSMERMGLDPKKIITISPERYQDMIGRNPTTRVTEISYTHSKLTDVLECWIDDFTLIDAPFSEQETDPEHSAIVGGQEPEVFPNQNHKSHVDSHMSYLANLHSLAQNDEDKQHAEMVSNAMSSHIAKHLQYRMDGKQKKYPYGRKIVRAGGEIVENVPNPHADVHLDWRRLFRWIDFEKVPGQMWGRGMPEILYNTNKLEDLMSSRIADIGLASVPQVWLSEENRAVVEKDGYSIDLTKPHFFIGAPPQFPQGRAPAEFQFLLKLAKDNAAKTQGISSVTYGQTPSPSASGDLAELLLRQNSVIVTGEAANNLADAIEQMIETRLILMKQFYTEPRKYFWDGEWHMVNVSEMLSVQPVLGDDGQPLQDEQGKPITQPIPDLYVHIKSNSNLPNQWEVDLQLAKSLFELRDVDGTPAIPLKAMLDILAERYPQFAVGGQYSQLNQATKIGLEILKQQQQEQQEGAEHEKMLQDVAKGIQKKHIRQQAEARVMPQEQPANGQQE